MCQLTVEVDAAVLADAECAARNERTTVTDLVERFVRTLAARAPDRSQAVTQRLRETFARFSRDMGERRWTRESLYER